MNKLKSVIKFLLYSWRLPRDIIFCFIKLGYWNHTWRFYGLPIISKHKKAQIIIGDNFVSRSKSKGNVIGVIQPVILTALNPESKIIIGNNVGISGSSINANTFISVGNDVLIGSGVIIQDNDAHSLNPSERHINVPIISKSVIIEDNVFIGTRSIILKGVHIGYGSIIGAGSVVTKSINKLVIAAGNPARELKSIYGS
jgi:acetyltransferase-like isoleucine patch superfamily enzyme